MKVSMGFINFHQKGLFIFFTISQYSYCVNLYRLYIKSNWYNKINVLRKIHEVNIELMKTNNCHKIFGW